LHRAYSFEWKQVVNKLYNEDYRADATPATFHWLVVVPGSAVGNNAAMAVTYNIFPDQVYIIFLLPNASIHGFTGLKII
jgi:hypothetical protein